MGDNQQPDKIEIELNAKVDQALDRTKRDIERPSKKDGRYGNLLAAEIIRRIERTCREITTILPLVNPIDSLSTAPVQPGALVPATLPQDERVLNGAKTLLEHEAQVLIDLIDALVEKEE